MKALVWLVGSVGLSILGAGAARACSCEQISPAQGFERAQYVFTGQVVETIEHTWTSMSTVSGKGLRLLPSAFGFWMSTPASIANLISS
jgi:hypothetical protein